MGRETALLDVPKKPKGKNDPPASPMRQMAFRVPDDLGNRLDDVAESLGLDTSNFLRMMTLECLPLYEERAKKIAEGRSFPP